MHETTRSIRLQSAQVRAAAIAAVLAVIAVFVPGLFERAGAAPGDPSQVTNTLEGCRNNGDISLPDGNGKFICPDSTYTTGNLGKGWNELDLVPYRLTTSVGTQAGATTDYVLAIVADHEDGGAPGYDLVSVPVVNTAKSDASCSITATPGPADPDGAELTPGIGGTDISLYRKVTIHQSKGTTCVFDYYERLALGSHEYPGSSLHSNLTNQDFGTAGVGARDVSIPVKEILPQELRKTMTASQDQDFAWNVFKDATPARLDFAETCSATPGPSTRDVSVTVRWEKVAGTAGAITVITNVYAKNPASRTITVNVTDDIRSGTTVLHSLASGPVNVPANTELLVLQHSTTVPAGSTSLNDVATATYTDLATGVPVPGTTQATASASVQTGAITNATAVITDTESITGTNLQFAVLSTSGASGSFDNYPTLGTYTTGPVNWTSATQSGNGSVTFDKRVKVTAPSNTTGTLSDTATVTGSSGFTASANASVAITANATVGLTINKTIPAVLASGETASFTFQVSPGASFDAGNVVASRVVNFGAGQTAGSAGVTGLAPGTYTVHELDPDGAGGWNPDGDQTTTINLPSCSGSVSFQNTFGPAVAQARKVTVPAGAEAGWDLFLSGPGTPAGGEQATTTGTGYVVFSTVLQEGAYTITETPRAGWDQTGSSAECSFTVSYPADFDRVFSCTLTNTQRGSITIVKDAVPDDAQDFAYTTTGSGLSPFSLDDDADPTLPNTRTFTDLVPGAYTVTETLPVAGWDLTGMGCASTNGASSVNVDLATGVATVTLGAGDSVTCQYRNTERAHVTVLKTENGGVPTTQYTFRLTGGPDNVSITRTTDGTNQGSLDFGLVRPGTYTLCELAVPAGTHSTLEDQGGIVDATTGDVCLTFTLAAGEERNFTVDNSRPGGGQRTIGYWRNWNSCSGTGNDRVAMAAKTGNHLLDEFLPRSLGGYAVDTCAKALAVLQAASGKYAENQLAAQLLAAKLNVAAGASTCASVNTAIAHADALLVSIGYSGPPSAKVRSNHAARADFLATAALLDDYNNGLVC